MSSLKDKLKAEARLKPTEEQQDALDLFTTGDNLAIEAGAGTGKTSTLKMIGASSKDKGQYIAFNKAIVEEAKTKMPRNIKSNTAHSLAFGHVVTPNPAYKSRLFSGQRMRSIDIANFLGVKPMVVECNGAKKVLSAGYLGSCVMNGITRFCNSDAYEISSRHLPYIDGIDMPHDGKKGYDNNNVVRERLVPHMRKAWDEITDENGYLQFKHEHYLKIWQLGDPHIPADFILFDEAQDANPVILDIVKRQDHAQLVFVGDSCQPTGTVVSVVESVKHGQPTIFKNVAIEDLNRGDIVASYDMSSSFFRRTGNQITGISSRKYDGVLVSIKTSSGLQSKYTPDHRCVVRISNAFKDKYIVYLMRKNGAYRIGKAQGTYSSQNNIFGLACRASAEGADAAWVLSVHDTDGEALAQEMSISYAYGIPSWTFKANKSHALGQPGLDNFWKKVSNVNEARICLERHGRNINFPLWEPSTGNMMMKRASVVRACNLMDGMSVLPMRNALDSNGKQISRKQWEAISVSTEEYSGLVWSMDVEGNHTYVGDGIITHNCQQIYTFTGAINAMQNVDAENKTYLTQSFRFGEPIAQIANYLLTRLGAELRLKGFDQVESEIVLMMDDADVILTRTNACAIESCIGAQAQGKQVYLMGGAGDMLRFTKAAQELITGKKTYHPELACFNDWFEVQEYVSQDEQGSDLKLMVDLIGNYGCDIIIKALDQTVSEAKADLIISTAHKSKGCEWNNVKLAGDFPAEEKLNPEELRLMYVACTRAKNKLAIGAIDCLVDRQ